MTTQEPKQVQRKCPYCKEGDVDIEMQAGISIISTSYEHFFLSQKNSVRFAPIENHWGNRWVCFQHRRYFYFKWTAVCTALMVAVVIGVLCYTRVLF